MGIRGLGPGDGYCLPGPTGGKVVGPERVPTRTESRRTLRPGGEGTDSGEEGRTEERRRGSGEREVLRPADTSPVHVRPDLQTTPDPRSRRPTSTRRSGGHTLPSRSRVRFRVPPLVPDEPPPPEPPGHHRGWGAEGVGHSDRPPPVSSRNL